MVENWHDGRLKKIECCSVVVKAALQMTRSMGLTYKFPDCR